MPLSIIAYVLRTWLSALMLQEQILFPLLKLLLHNWMLCLKTYSNIVINKVFGQIS